MASSILQEVNKIYFVHARSKEGVEIAGEGRYISESQVWELHIPRQDLPESLQRNLDAEDKNRVAVTIMVPEADVISADELPFRKTPTMPPIAEHPAIAYLLSALRFLSPALGEEFTDSDRREAKEDIELAIAALKSDAS